LVLITNFGGTAGFNNQITINSDTGTNYSETDLGTNGATASSASVSNVAFIRAGYIDTSAERAMSMVNFMNYANTSTYKTVLIRWDSNSYTYARTSLWRSTSAITAVTCTSGAGAFTAGSTFALYGIKAA
jgi:hypothetical protein